METRIVCCPDFDDSGAPVDPDNERVLDLVTLKTDLTLIPTSSFEEALGSDGKRYYVLEYDIMATFSSGSTKFELSHDGLKYGEVETELA